MPYTPPPPGKPKYPSDHSFFKKNLDLSMYYKNNASQKSETP